MKIPVAPFTLDSKAHLKMRYIYDRNEYALQDALLDIVSAIRSIGLLLSGE